MSLARAESVISRAKDQAVWPWQAEPFKLWSLLDMMQRFEVAKVVTGIMNIAQASAHGSSEKVSELMAGAHLDGFVERLTRQAREQNVHIHIDQDRHPDLLGPAIRSMFHRSTKEFLVDAFELLRDAPLPSRLVDKLASLKDWIEAQKPEEFDSDSAPVSLRELGVDMILELRDHTCLFVRPERRALYEQSEPLFGEPVATVFPDATRDIAAAGRCLALDEWTACVFHLMRTLEHGLRTLGVAVGLQAEALTHENWKNIIDQIEKKVREMESLPKTPEKSEKLKFYSGACVQFRYFKDAWRNHVSHSRVTYDEREADSVFTHVKEFMQHMAANS